MPTKLVVTDVSAMKKKYKASWPKVRQAVGRLARKDAARGITTTLVALDGANLGASRAKARQPETFKAAIDHVWSLHHQPDYILILGGPDIVPHQSLRNTVPPDDDPDVPSDLPYACEAPASDDPSTFIAPTRVVGRLPDVPGDRSPRLLVGLLDAAAAWKPKTKADYKGYFGLSAHTWRQSTAKSLKALFGAAAATRTSPNDGPLWKKTELSPLSHFINCHGGTIDPQFYGQKGEEFPVAHQAVHLPDKVARGTVVAAECCYGAELYEPDGTPEGICVHYLREGAIAFMGSTCTAYGPSTTNGDADLICRFFLEGAIAGASFGRALLEARLRFVQEGNPLNPVELKTLAQFVLLGDPSLRATGTAPKGSPKAKSMAMARAARPHTLHRGSLTAKAATLGKGVDSVAAAPIGGPPPAVRAALDKAARQEGFVPVKKAQTYAVQQAPDPVFRAALAKKAFTPVRYHMMMAKPAPAAPTPVGATIARVRSDVRAKGKSRAEAPRPKTVHANLLLLAREVGGKVLEVERLYTKARRNR
ncbi:MAG TPA: C25 family cysteine peptidase [Vicinamibacteria bacterium]